MYPLTNGCHSGILPGWSGCIECSDGFSAITRPDHAATDFGCIRRQNGLIELLRDGKALHDEGIEFHPLPILPDDHN
jgi:hypothetical protein